MKVSLIDPIGGHGGMDYYDYGLAYGLGHNDIIVYYYTCSKTKERFYKNVNTKNIFKNVWKKNKLFKLFFFCNSYLKAFKSSKKEGTEIFHFQFFSLGILNLLVLILASFFKQKKIITLHDIESFHKSSSKIVSSICLKLIDGVIIHNQYSKSEFEKKFSFNGHISIIPHGNYLPFIKTQALNTNTDEINLLFFGQIKQVKGLGILLEAMSIVVKKSTKYKLTIAGRPWKTGVEYYKNKIRELKLSEYVTTHFEYIKEEEISELYKNASIIVMPYKKIYQSGVLLLSFSYGRTVITSDLPAFKEIISDGKNGFMFESENSLSLANTILKLDNKLISKVTKNTNNLISNKYDWKTIGRATLNFYEKII
ncbi:MAG: hypothetical protein CL844_06130 [Crocinitomicaceae bacterium]|nr:hypothetical protein [Crocinitomicaceae bacterium]|tara:strand:+ start:25743 stop:26843 length:1101 start_codon:yes stop_codon:yes gene_type:complete